MKLINFLVAVYAFCMMINTFSMNQKQLVLVQDDGYLKSFNTSQNIKQRKEFNESLEKWHLALPTQKNLEQSEYEKQFIQKYHEGILSGGFSSVEAEKFVPQLVTKEQKGIFEEAMLEAGISENFSKWLGNHEKEAKKLLISKLASRLENLKNKTPDNIRNGIRAAFDDKKISPSNSTAFWYGSITTALSCGLIWAIKSYVEQANLF